MERFVERWQGMSVEEREAFAGERASQIQEDRDTKLTGTHTCAVKAFRDVSNTIVRVENIVSDVYLSIKLFSAAECLFV